MQPWIRIRKQLYHQLEAHVRELLGPESVGVARYRAEYEKEFRQRWRVSSREALIEEVEKSSVVLLGDFHALQQSQKSQLRILKAVSATRPLVLLVECFEAVHQKVLDRYLAGQLPEKEFLKAIQWQKNWGFPWEHYRPLFRWAQKRKIPVRGLNRRLDHRSGATLQARDRFAAELVGEVKKSSPEALAVVIFGDLHLASQHLPKALAKILPQSQRRVLSVFQNSESLYFKLLERGLELDTDVVKLSKDQFCVLNVPPWVKWQNYLLFLERHLDREISEGHEYTDEVENYLKILKSDLGVTVPEGSFAVFTPEDPGFWDQLSETFAGGERRFLQGWIERGASFYLPEIATAFLARPTVNHAASIAMAVFHAHLAGRKKTPFEMPRDFLRLVWLETIQYFGTKLINPKRKTDTLQDLKSSMAAYLPNDLGKEALQLALMQKMSEVMWLSGVRKKRELLHTKRAGSYQEAARLLGGMLGERLFMGYRRRMISPETLVGLVQRPVEIETFDAFYYEVLELIESLPEPFLSKSEKL